LFPEFAFSVLAADAQWVAENDDLLVLVLRALLDATDWLYDDLAGGAAVLVEETGVESRLAELSMRDLVEGTIVPRDLEPNRAGLELVLRIMRDNGRLADGAPLDLDAYLDLSCLKRAQA
jgi:ABC-type nitrate/sulfonate/bicarbonate transport system substrate-binding protein